MNNNFYRSGQALYRSESSGKSTHRKRDQLSESRYAESMTIVCRQSASSEYVLLSTAHCKSKHTTSYARTHYGGPTLVAMICFVAGYVERCDWCIAKCHINYAQLGSVEITLSTSPMHYLRHNIGSNHKVCKQHHYRLGETGEYAWCLVCPSYGPCSRQAEG